MAAKINFNKNLVSYILGRYLYLLLKYRVEVACNQFYTQNTFFFSISRALWILQKYSPSQNLYFHANTNPTYAAGRMPNFQPLSRGKRLL